MKIKTSALTGVALDWAVAKCEGRREPEVVNNFAVAWYTWPNTHYSTNWAQGGAIIEREKIRLDCAWNPGPWKGSCKIDGVTAWTEGPTPLIAAMRCYVASKLGDEVEVLDELKGECAYKFDELDARAKNKVREWFFCQDTDFDYVIDDFKEKGAKLGFRLDDVRYSVSRGQGDGASWTGQVDIAAFAARVPVDDPNYAAYMVLIEMMREGWIDSTLVVTRVSFWYSHSGTMGLEGIRLNVYHDEQSAISDGILAGALIKDLYDSVVTEDFIDTVQETILKEAQSFADDLYKALVEAYEWEISDENIAECADINEWLFDAEGKIL